MMQVIQLMRTCQSRYLANQISVADPEIVERGPGVTEWSELYHMAIRPQSGGTRRMWEGDMPPPGRKCES